MRNASFVMGHADFLAIPSLVERKHRNLGGFQARGAVLIRAGASIQTYARDIQKWRRRRLVSVRRRAQTPRGCRVASARRLRQPKGPPSAKRDKLRGGRFQTQYV